jgi:hypothetical protein
MYYIGYGITVGIGLFFVYYFVMGGRMALAQELTQFIVAFGFFIVLFFVGFLSSKKKIKRQQAEGSIDEQVAIISSTTQKYDKITTGCLGLIILLIALYDGSFDIVDFAQIIVTVSLLLIWRVYLFKSRRLEPYNTVAGLNYFDKMYDSLIVVAVPIIILTIPALGKVFNTTEIVQAVSVFAVAYSWHNYLFTRKK